MTKRQVMQFVASFVMLLLLVAIVAYFTYIPVPVGNKEVIITVLGVILGGGAAAMPNLFGDKDAETEKLKGRIRNLEEQLNVVLAKYQDVSERYESLISMLVSRHFIPNDPKLPPTLPEDMRIHTKDRR